MGNCHPSGDAFIPPVLLASMDRIEASRKKRVVAHRIMSIVDWILFLGGFALMLALPFVYIFQAGEETETAKAITKGIPGPCCVFANLVILFARLPLYRQLRTRIKKGIFEPSLFMS